MSLQKRGKSIRSLYCASFYTFLIDLLIHTGISGESEIQPKVYPSDRSQSELLLAEYQPSSILSIRQIFLQSFLDLEHTMLRGIKSKTLSSLGTWWK